MNIFDKFKKIKETEEPAVKTTDKKEAQVSAKPIVLKEPAKVKAVKDSVSKSPVALEVLIKPLITEKATNLAQFNQYVFEISKSANKIQVARAIEARYGVKPIKINILNNQGKVTRYGRTTGKTKDWKKAIITLAEGQTIQVHEGV